MIYHALDTQTILVSKVNSLLVQAFSWDLLTIRKKLEYQQPCPLKCNLSYH